MKNVFSKCFAGAVAAAALAVTTGCPGPRPPGIETYPEGGVITDEDFGGGIPMATPGAFPENADRSVVEPVYFAYDSSSVSPAEVGKCEEVARLLNKGDWEGVIIEGHADERGSREYNQSLGERRALAVRDYLISLGVDPAQVQTASYGEEQPADLGHDESAYSKNRRAVFAMF